MELVRQKHNAENTTQARAAREACSRGLREEFEKYVSREKEALKKAPKTIKGWWTKSGRLLRQRARTSAIPALRNGSGEWILEAKGKSDLLAVSLQSKCVLVEAVTNQYTEVESQTHRAMKEPAVVTEKMAEKELCALA